MSVFVLNFDNVMKMSPLGPMAADECAVNREFEFEFECGGGGLRCE